jgi:hypothetical protein
MGIIGGFYNEANWACYIEEHDDVRRALYLDSESC